VFLSDSDLMPYKDTPLLKGSPGLTIIVFQQTSRSPRRFLPNKSSRSTARLSVRALRPTAAFLMRHVSLA
jgi:hypothetical protein